MSENKNNRFFRPSEIPTDTALNPGMTIITEKKAPTNAQANEPFEDEAESVDGDNQ